MKIMIDSNEIHDDINNSNNQQTNQKTDMKRHREATLPVVTTIIMIPVIISK